MTEYTASQKRKYLAGVLRLNPVQNSGQIIRFRNRLLGKVDENQRTAVDEQKLSILRDRANKQIEAVRGQMWRQHPKQLAQMLQDIDVAQLPELKSAVQRLRVVIQNHGAIMALAQHPDHHINLTNTLKRVVMLSPRESGALKEAYLRQIIESSDLNRIKRFVGVLHDEFHNVYAMESDWLGKIQNLKGRKRISHAGEGADVYETGIPGWLIWIGLIFLFRIIAAVVSAL